MPKDVAKKSKKMRGGALEGIKQDVIDNLTAYPKLQAALIRLNTAISSYTDDMDNPQPVLLNIVNELSGVLALLDRNMTPKAEEAEEAEEAEKGITPAAMAAHGGGSRKKKSSSKKVKRVGGNVDMSKLYNVAGLIVDSKDPVAVAGGIGPDSTPMPFSANGQGLRYTGGIPTEFMNDLNPSLGQQGGAKKKGKGKK